MTDLEEIYNVQKTADRIYSNADIEAAIENMAVNINHFYQGLNPIVLCIMNGGVVFCGKLLPLLRFPLQFDYAHATRYNNTTDGKTLEWRVVPTLDLRGRDVLIVDDIYDVGETLAGVIEACEKQKALSVKSAVLVNKVHDRKYDPSFSVDFVALEAGDRYLFGYGMDYKSYLRNAPGIYAVGNSLGCEA
ncbi:MAG: hypoxanthine-guanine phosphoribosyltransferase [Gammaproteobacteria bacterium]|nr:hypoxanthine-guanine phosphoribosyltransferase [Gammaproteobacteria bacterium]